MSPDRLSVGLEGRVPDLDPVTGQLDVPGMIAANCIYDPLAAYTPDGVVRPYLAEAILTEENYGAVTIVLRNKIHFHDGGLLDSGKVADLLERHRGSILTGPALARVDRIVPLDRLRLRVTFNEPWASFPALLTGQIGLMSGLQQGPDVPAVGTGPYVAEARDAGLVELVAHPDHWRAGLPRTRSVRLVSIPDPAAREAAFAAGEIDLFHTTHAPTIERWRQTAPTQLIEAAHGSTDTGCIMLNLVAGPTSDLELRRALAHALDRQRLVKRVFGDLVPVVDSPLSGLGAAPQFPDFDCNKAKHLVQRYFARVGSAPIVRLATTETPKNREFAVSVAAMWGKAGIATRIEHMPQDQLIFKALTGDFDAIEWHQFGAGDTEENAVFWDPANAAPPGSMALNMTRNADPLLGDALRRGRCTADPERRRLAYRDVAERLNATLAYLWINQTPYGVVFREGLTGVCKASFPDGSLGLGMIAGRFPVAEIAITRPRP